MSVVTANGALRSLFQGLKEKTEVRDDSGNVLGYYTPLELEEELLYRHADTVFDSETIRRQAQTETGGSSLDQVMKHLSTLEKR